MDLTGRTAVCSCGKTQASSEDLAFFVFRGAGSHAAVSGCATCGYHEIAHTRARELHEPHLARLLDHEFAPHGGHETDWYYCGCRGWD